MNDLCVYVYRNARRAWGEAPPRRGGSEAPPPEGGAPGGGEAPPPEGGERIVNNIFTQFCVCVCVCSLCGSDPEKCHPVFVINCHLYKSHSKKTPCVIIIFSNCLKIDLNKYR